MMMAYIHQNYVPFTNSIEQCADLLDYFSAADSVLSIDGGTVRAARSRPLTAQSTRHPLTSHYSFQVAVRGTIMSLPSPVPRRGQRMTKAVVWERNRVQRERMATVPELILGLSRATETSLIAQSALLNDGVPYLALAAARSAAVRQSLPTHCLALIRDLAAFPTVGAVERSARAGAALDETDLDMDSAAADADASGVAGGPVTELDAAAGELRIEADHELLYLVEDDIED